MNHPEALKIAQSVASQLSPFCEKIAIGGSIRRMKSEVKDIEIVAIPKPYEIGLFASGIATVVEQWPKVKGDLPCRYTQRILPEGIKLDLFMCDADNWGLIYALRTGPSDWNISFLLDRISRAGLVMREGRLWRGSDEIYVRDEESLFLLLREPFIEPQDRK